MIEKSLDSTHKENIEHATIDQNSPLLYSFCAQIHVVLCELSKENSIFKICYYQSIMCIGVLGGKRGPFKIDALITASLLLQCIEWYCNLTKVNMLL